MKKIIIILLFISSFLCFVSIGEARSGCCSHHGGVQSNGCGCNDGTPLSATCAPYYSCSNTYNTSSYNYSNSTNNKYKLDESDDSSCPLNSRMSQNGCVCNLGYERFNDWASWACLTKEEIYSKQHPINKDVILTRAQLKNCLVVGNLNNKKYYTKGSWDIWLMNLKNKWCYSSIEDAKADGLNN